MAQGEIMTPDEIDDLRSALSAAFGADRADEFDEQFLAQVVAEQSVTVRSQASEWGWNDTEVREQVCQTAEQLLHRTQ